MSSGGFAANSQSATAHNAASGASTRGGDGGSAKSGGGGNGGAGQSGSGGGNVEGKEVGYSIPDLWVRGEERMKAVYQTRIILAFIQGGARLCYSRHCSTTLI